MALAQPTSFLLRLEHHPTADGLKFPGKPTVFPGSRHGSDGAFERVERRSSPSSSESRTLIPSGSGFKHHVQDDQALSDTRDQDHVERLSGSSQPIGMA